MAWAVTGNIKGPTGTTGSAGADGADGSPRPRVVSTTSTATLTPDVDTTDQSVLTAQAAALTIANSTGTPAQGWQLSILIRDNGTTRAITYGTGYVDGPASRVANTIINKWHAQLFEYNATTAKFVCMASDPAGYA